jgi:hypothetical protein
LTAFLALTWCATEILHLREQNRTLQALLDREKQPLTPSGFAEAIYNQSAIINERILQLPGEVSWVDNRKRGNSLFARDCYKKLWDLVSSEKQKTSCFSICGNPGIGKSWFLFYVMYQLGVKNNRIVYAQTIGNLMEFMLIEHPNWVQHSEAIPSQQMHNALQDPSTWYLVDGPVNVSSLSRINARVLQVTSPDRMKFKEFLKAPAHQYFMPVWTHDELERCREQMYPTVSTEDLMELEHIAGPIPRFVLEGPSQSSDFAKAREKLEGDTKRAVVRMSLKDIAYAVGAEDVNDTRVTYRALQIEVDSTTFANIGLRLASPFVENIFFSRMTEIDSTKLWLTYRDTAGSIKGAFYEAWAHKIISGHGTTPLPMQSLEDKNITEHVVIGQRTLLLEQTYDQMVKINVATYCVPASKTFPTIDAVCLPYFFQMTIQPSHSIKLKHFANFVSEMIKAGTIQQEQNINLVFVVPSLVSAEYRKCVP